ncbi:unnamed protein product [Clonostachys byssicola]|uniref:Ams2/SPT21 N-terminal domain-containing protein n=1 Tax=Clonostachys byssicola TaxID=160290 RepID=A0A9N9UVI6_9HYPO|nr:unnamed protein product [Clonostachys byssicola]
MASPMPNQSYGSWNANNQPQPPQPEQDGSGLQVKPMGLKVHYTFDKDSKINCLARYPHPLNIQTAPIDERSSIGIIDLRLCIQTITECSPELLGQECDYTVYAIDYSEPDTPLAGQGMLSRAIDSLRGNMGGHPPKMVTGRVAKNMLGVFGSGTRETLEVKLKLTEAGKRPPPQEAHQQPPQQPTQQPPEQVIQQLLQQAESQQQHPSQPQQGPPETALTPTGAAEWNSFIQSNPHMGQSGNFSRGASPALSLGPAPVVHERRDSFARNSQPPVLQPGFQRIAPQPVDGATAAVNIPTAPTSRPSSRASNSGRVKKQPTGRPRGRPRKKPAEGNTSGYEDGTEGEDGPTKKRAKTTKAEKSQLDPFGTGPESLRVAASTSGSIRSFRPVGINSEGVPGSHLQEVPRAPTPVPKGPISGHHGRKQTTLRRESTMNREIFATQPSPLEERQSVVSLGQEDERSPESTAPTPAYSDDSQADIGSSPPVEPTASFLRSSPPLSSPDLPPMPEPRDVDGEKLPNEEDLTDLFGEEPIQVPPVERAPAHPQNRKTGPRNKPNSTAPIQIFRMEDGPDGQDMVHIRSFNAPEISPAVSGPSNVSNSTTTKKRAAKSRSQPAQKKPHMPSPPGLAPTPPPTTDGVEKPVSPMTTTSVVENLPLVDPNPSVSTSLPPPNHGPLTAFRQPPSEMDDALSNMVSPQEPVLEKQPEGLLEAPKEPIRPKPKETKAKPPPRKLARSQSAGPLALPLPAVPASEPAGPSSLSQSMTVEHEPATKNRPSNLRRSTSSGPLALPIPASDPVGPSHVSVHKSASLIFPEPCRLADLPPLPSSPTGSKSNKNIVKKHAIKQRLEAAIMNGEMPPFCSNCGAIETPTWRKIWVQDFDGAPGKIDFSSKPGKVTALEILGRDNDDKPTSYRLIKKSLGDEEDKPEWQGHLLCNPCGIWLVKSHSHRPQDRWDKDASRLGQRRKRANGAEGGRSRTKKSRTKSDARPNQTSQAPEADLAMSQDIPTEVQPTPQEDDPTPRPPDEDGILDYQPPWHQNQSFDEADMINEMQQYLGSTHSRGSEGSKTPTKHNNTDDGLGATKRLLFPSPRKDDSPKVLGEVDINIVHIHDESHQLKGLEGEENHPVGGEETNMEQEELEALFKSPAVARPSTPPPSSKAAPPSTPFKTPSRATPSHRPITRSVSRSIRSMRSKTSPGDVERTPTKTPRSRRSDRNLQSEGNFGEELKGWDTPCSTAIAKMLSDSHAMLSDPNFGFSDEMDIDFSDLPPMEATQNLVKDVSNWLSTDGAMPTSPVKNAHFFEYDGSADVLEQWNLMHGAELKSKK